MLRAGGAVALASVVTLTVELVFAELKSGDALTHFLAERLPAVKNLLDYYGGESPADEQAEKQITHLTMLGTSRLRRLLQPSSHAPRLAEQAGASLMPVGKPLGIPANNTHLTLQISYDDKKRIRCL